ncbi:MAG: hypothetical protein HY748_12185 [Elusimicrobia bacterium]|nr:hypothetical protein [Elusimicrobiota bacterium]
MSTDESAEDQGLAVGPAPFIIGLLGLAVFLAAAALALKSFSGRESRPPAWDQSVHLEIALDYRDAWADRDLGKIWKLAPKPGMPPFPPLYHLGMMLLMDPADPVATSLRINWVYLALMTLSVFMIAYHFRPDATALAAAIAFAATPIVARLYHTQLVDLSVAAFAGLAFWALLASRGFRRWPGSLAFGALFAAGMLHKWSFFTYMAPAYLMGAAALFDGKCRHKAVVAAAIGIAGCAPWYAAHLPILVPRLLQASADYGVPVTRGWAFLQYFMESINALGAPFWFLAWLGLWIPDAQRNKNLWWVLPAGVFFAYFIWALVPNRQMRFFLPGLVPLAASLAIAGWPKPVTWALAGFQLLLAVNFSAGWIAPLTVKLPYAKYVPFPPIELTPGDPPRREDWKIGEILREVDSRRDKTAPAANLTLVANDTYFNGPNFSWTVKREKLSSAVSIRGVNSRLCEFSQFIVLKKGCLGPEKVIEGLPKAAAIIQDPDQWVAAAYEPARRWPLPDQSEAVLYQRKRLRTPPLRSGRASFDSFISTSVTASRLRLDVGRWNGAKGVFESVEVLAKEVSIRDLKVSGLDAVMEGVGFIPLASNMPVAQSYWDDLRFLEMQRLKLKSLSVAAEDLKAFLEKRVKGLKVKSLGLEKDIVVDATIKGISVRLWLSAAMRDSPKSVVVSVERLDVGVTPLPVWVLGTLSRVTVSLEPNAETPFFIDLPGFTIRDGKITVP